MNVKPILMMGVAMIALGGVVTWKELVKPSLAATEEHGDSHAHEEGEESHDKEKEEHGHGHDEPEAEGHGSEGEHGEEGHNEEEGALKLSPEQISASGVKTAKVQAGTLSHEVSVPGKIVADANRMAEMFQSIRRCH